jgi:hypothetical protein
MLAKAIADPNQLRLLRKGATVKEAKEETRPAEHRVSDSLTTVHSALGNVLVLLSESSVKSDEAESLLSLSQKVRSLAYKAHRELERVAGVAEDVDD